MTFLREKGARRYFLLLCGAGVLLLLSSILLTGYHASETQKLLFVRENAVVSSLLEQQVPEEVIAAAMKSEAVTDAGAAFLARIGHTERLPFFLFPLARHTAVLFGITACALTAFLVLLLLLLSCVYLRRQEKMYQTVLSIVSEYSEGCFQRHLPQNENGLLYQMFGGIEELAAALQAKTENEQKAREFLKDMISSISHQLKTPLAALTMYTEIILEEPENSHTVSSFAGKSLQSLKRMEQLIQILLKMARLDSGSIVFDKKPCHVSELAEQAEAPFAERAEREGKQIVIEGAPDTVLFCDLGWTSEALGNLIKNALDHTQSGGMVQVKWEHAPDMLRLTVSDDGCGILPADIPHIFKHFYRSRNSSDKTGVGLGLPLAKAVVEGQGGLLSVSSEPGYGTVFIISFPAELTEL